MILIAISFVLGGTILTALLSVFNSAIAPQLTRILESMLNF